MRAARRYMQTGRIPTLAEIEAIDVDWEQDVLAVAAWMISASSKGKEAGNV